MQTSRFAIPKTYLLVVGLLALAWLWVGVANAAKVKVYEIRQARMGLAPKDTITVIVTTLEGKYSPELENEVVGCISNAFYEQNLSTVRVVPPNEFRRVAFPDLTPEQVLGQPWNQRMSDPVFRERIAPMGLRYLIAVTVSQGKSLTRYVLEENFEWKGFYVRARVPHWKWQRIAVMSAKILDLRQLQVSGKVSASVQKTSRFSYAPVPFVIPSFVKGRACEEFGKALASFLTSEKPAKKIIISSLTLENLFPRRRSDHEKNQDMYMFTDSNSVVNLDTVTLKKVLAPDPRIPKSLLLGVDEMAQFVEQMETSVPDKPESKEIYEVAATSRWEEVRPLIKARKELVVTEDENARWPTRGAGFQNDWCYEIKLSLNTVSLNTEKLPPLPSRWHLAPVWAAKVASLPMQLSIPILAILFPRLGVFWGLEAIYNCVPQLRDNQVTDQDTYIPNGSGPGINSTTQTVFAPTINPSPISIHDDHRGTGIHYAAENGDADRVQSLIKSSKDLVSAKNNAGLTPLHLAASNGQNDVAEVLLANNADVNPRDWQGVTPMQLAVAQGHKDIVYLLLKYGAKD